MARGSDSGSPQGAPPARNPFRQEITANPLDEGISPAEDDSLQEESLSQPEGGQNRGSSWRQDAEEESRQLTQEVQEHLLGYFEQPGESRMLRKLTPPKYASSEDAIYLAHRLAQENGQILHDLSLILETHAGDDLDLANKLEALLAASEETLFTIQSEYISYNDSGSWTEGSCWVHALNEAVLGRFLRNMKRIILIHRRDEAPR